MITVAQVTNTCKWCPAQWQGVTDDGLTVYVRYRWGYLLVELAGQPLFDANIGGGFDGYMSFEELKAATTGVISWPQYETEREPEDAEY